MAKAPDGNWRACKDYRPSLTEEVREALMRLTMCAREECEMCKYKNECGFDFQYKISTDNMHTILNAFNSADIPTPNYTTESSNDADENDDEVIEPSDLISRAEVLSLFPNAFYDGLASQIKALPSADAEQGFRGGKIPPNEMLNGTVLIPQHQWIEMERELAELKEKFVSADRPTIVRCKDCRWQKISRKSGLANCGHELGMMRADDNNFCSYGERKGGAE